MRANVFIRQENEDAWRALDNKSEWINERLGGTFSGDPIKPESNLNFKKEEKISVSATQKFNPKAPDPELGYDCCQRSSPCKHWVWDDAMGEGYVNTLTGNRKEV